MPTVGIVFELSLRPEKAAKPVTVEPPTVFKMQDSWMLQLPKRSIQLWILKDFSIPANSTIHYIMSDGKLFQAYVFIWIWLVMYVQGWTVVLLSKIYFIHRWYFNSDTECTAAVDNSLYALQDLLTLICW